MGSRAEDELAALVDAVKCDPSRRDSLTGLLEERLALYRGLGTNATVRMRGYLIAAYETVGLPPAALPYVLEELESGRQAYLVAAAAKALRGLDGPAGHLVPFLLKAIRNIMYADDAVSFESYHPARPLPKRTTAMEELMRTLAWLGPHAGAALPELEQLHATTGALSAPARETLAGVLSSLRGTPGCCQPADETVRLVPHVPASQAVPVGVEFEDQDGRSLTFGDYFTGGTAVVVFFYTRCDNPNKCSLSITKLAGLQQALRDRGLRRRVRTAAITYDPGFDLPGRLRAYGENRGIIFGESDRFLRTTNGFPALREYFDLGVNFGPALVNRHRIELYLLDAEGRVSHASTRLQWNHDEILSTIQRARPAGRQPGAVVP